MIRFDPASFKDPSGRVFFHGRWTGRTLTEEARADFRAASGIGLIGSLEQDGLLVPSELVSAHSVGLAEEGLGEFVIRQPRVPVVSYSYEWSFEMLRDAALVTLQILDRALAAGFVLKDAPAFNILFDGTVPRLIDVLSLVPYRDGELWAGYAQFCRSFLFPLLLASYRQVDSRLLLRGAFGEVPVRDAANLFRMADSFRPGVFTHVLTQARLERTFAGSSRRVGRTVSGIRYPKTAFAANVRRLTHLVASLKAPSAPGEWSAYDAVHSYSESDIATKASFVDRVLASGGGRRIVDLGCNTGAYSKIALRTGAHVVAVDLDSQAVDRLYRSLPAETRLSPVVASLLNPTPAMGWGLEERGSLLERLAADRFLALALIHHLRITGGVPLESIVAHLFAIAPEGIIEWIDKDDDMVKRLLALRPDVYADYEWPAFEAIVRRHGEVIAVESTHRGHRRLCHVCAHA